MTMSVWPEPFSTEGQHVTIVPLSKTHHDDLFDAAADGQLHRLWYTMVPEPDGIIAEIERRLALHKIGSMLPFTVIENSSGRAVGMTTFVNIDASSRRLEIGATWYRQSVQRTAVNTECKLLLLRHAFERLDCICVGFRTHFINARSRQAIERLGAKLDGILRSNMIIANGTIRDTAVYSIIQSEWPTVKANLMWKLEKPAL